MDQNPLVRRRLLPHPGSASPGDRLLKDWWHQEPFRARSSIPQRRQTWPGVTLCSLALPRASRWLQICWGCRQITRASALGGEINFPCRSKFQIRAQLPVAGLKHGDNHIPRALQRGSSISLDLPGIQQAGKPRQAAERETLGWLLKLFQRAGSPEDP